MKKLYEVISPGPVSPGLRRLSLVTGLTVLLWFTAFFASAAGALMPNPGSWHTATVVLYADTLITVRGTVTDSASGSSLAGATIQVLGTSIGTTSDANGAFILHVPDEAVLQVSILGYDRKDVRVSGSTFMHIALNPSVTGLSKLVVVGYGTVKKSDLTGSVSVVKSKDIESAPVASLDQALQGKAAGVQVTSVNGAPGAGTTIRIRGGNSISASNEPLYVVDGFVGGGDLTSINPNDIASIEILKDASATAIYGARGANGVILITTKHGKEGKPQVLVNVYAGMQQLPREISLLKGPDLAAYANENAAFFGTAPIYPDLSKVTNTDWQKAITRDAGMQNANVAISGGSKNLNYYLSGNYFNQDGIILNSGFRRYQTRLNLDLNLTNWLKIGTNLNFSRSNTNNNKVNLLTVLRDAPTSLPVKDSAGNYSILNPLTGRTFENPVADALESLDNTYENDLLGNWYIEASFKNGLQFRSTLAIDNDNTKRDEYLPGSLPLRHEQQKGGYAYISSSQSLNLLNENTVSYQRQFGKHHLNLLGGFTYQHQTTESYSATGEGFTNDLLTYNNLATGDPLLAANGSGYSEWTILSWLGRVNYSYGPYLLTVTGRQDGSSRLAANHKHAFFPSAAFAWRLSDEDFIKNLNVFSSLKFRLSYGKTGNQAIDVYSTLASLAVTNAWFHGQEQLGYTLGNIPNADLKWETTDEYNAGLDAGFLNGRLSLVLDAYYKKTYNLLLTVDIPGTTGYSSRLENVGSVANKGIELSIDGVIADRKDFSWNVGFNIAANRNKVLELGEGISYRDAAQGARLIVGKPAPVFYGAVFESVFKSQAEIDAVPGYQSGLHPGYIKFKDVNGNGKYDGLADYDIIGNPEPSFYGGFTSSARYKKLSLDLYVNYSYGNDIMNSLGPRFFVGNYDSNLSDQMLKRWTPANNQSNIPGVGAYQGTDVNSRAYSFSVQDGSFLRLKTLTLRYDLTPAKLSWMTGASVYVTASNLFILDNYTWGYDPEVNSEGTSPILRGFDGYSYPQNRSYILGVTLNF